MPRTIFRLLPIGSVFHFTAAHQPETTRPAWAIGPHRKTRPRTYIDTTTGSTYVVGTTRVQVCDCSHPTTPDTDD
jgi:hypothetical protein